MMRYAYHLRWAIVAILAALLPDAVRAGPLEDWQRTMAFQKQQAEKVIADAGLLDPSNPSRPATEVLSLAVEQQLLVLRTALPSTPVNKPVKLKLGSSKNWAVLNIRGGAQGIGGAGAVVPAVFEMSIYDFEPDRTRVLAVEFVKDNVMFITTQNQTIHGNEVMQLQEQLGIVGQFAASAPQTIGKCHLVYSNVVPGQPLHPQMFDAATISALAIEHPAEVDRYLQPAFSELGQESALAPDPMVAFEVFSNQWSADEATTAKVNSLVASLAGEDFHARVQAQHELTDLGKNAALVLMHLDRSKLSPEQNARIDKLLAPYFPVPIQQAEKWRSDPDFLVNCLYSSDVVVRKTALAQLLAVTKLPLTFDPAADAATRTQAISALLKQLAAAKGAGK